MGCYIRRIEYAFPKKTESINDIKRNNSTWDINKIVDKSGILKRYISNKKETCLYLALKSSKKLLKNFNKNKIDFVIFVSQTYEKNLTTASCIIQDQVGLKKKIIAIDLNLGCSGFIYALKIGHSFFKDSNINNGIIVCSDTYTKHISINNRSCRPIFSDGSAAILLSYSKNDKIISFNFGSDGSGTKDLYIPNTDIHNSKNNYNNILMNGSNVALFAMSEIPKSVLSHLKKTKMSLKKIDLVIFHQASKYVIDNLTRILGISKNKVFSNYKNIGNTISSSIPIALKDAYDNRVLKNNNNVLLIGFGVGLSWGSVIIKFNRFK